MDRKYTRDQYAAWEERKRNLKWYQLERDPDGTPYVVLFAKALLSQPAIWVAIGVLVLALALPHK